MKNQPKPKPVMTIKKVTKKVAGPMPKTNAVSPSAPKKQLMMKTTKVK